MIEPPETVRQWFVDAGWYPGRTVAVPASVPSRHPARDILAAYGGLILLEREPSEPWDPNQELVFGELYPNPAVTLVWGQLLQSRLVGVARVDNDHGQMYIGTDGRCFGSSNIHSAFWYYGATFNDAVEGIWHRRRSRPMLRPDQRFVTLYGVRFTRNSPELYRYER